MANDKQYSNDEKNVRTSTEIGQGKRSDAENEQGVSHESGSKRRTAEETSTSGAGSSQRTHRDNVGPLESDLEQLPSEKRLDRGNLTGPGLG